MKKLTLTFLGCMTILCASAQSKKISIAVNDKVKIDMVLITPDTFVRKNYYGDTLCDYSRICPVMGKRAYSGYDTIVLAPYYIATVEVTQQLYSAVMHQNPSYWNDNTNHSACQNTPELLPVTLRFLEVDTRVGCRPEYISNGIGFRLAMDAEGVEP